MLVYYSVPFIVSNRYLLFWVSNGHNSVNVQNRTHLYVNFFDHKDLGNHLLQLCPKVVKHPVYITFFLADIYSRYPSLPPPIEILRIAIVSLDPATCYWPLSLTKSQSFMPSPSFVSEVLSLLPSPSNQALPRPLAHPCSTVFTIITTDILIM